MVIAVMFVVLSVVLVFRVANGKEYIPETQEKIWLIEVFVRIKKAGFNVFFSILGIVASIVLVIYRSMLSYFYLKLYKSDDTFYSARLGENVFFIVASLVAIVIFAVFSFSAKSALPPEINPLMIIFMVLYSLAVVLPLTEISIVYIKKGLAKRKKVVTAPTKDDIIDELDSLADKTTEEMVNEKTQDSEE